jgi:hypothetical protein
MWTRASFAGAGESGRVNASGSQAATQGQSAHIWQPRALSRSSSPVLKQLMPRKTTHFNGKLGFFTLTELQWRAKSTHVEG